MDEKLIYRQANCLFCDLVVFRDFSCKAFPDGIPNVILSGDNRHDKPLKDQGNDIVFVSKFDKINEPKEKVGGPDSGIEPYKISTDSKDYRPRKKILTSVSKSLK